jgi:methylmalonyl-CoA/ethylmalonyl-CoA epimerase
VTNLPFKILGINHLGIVPKDFALAGKFLSETLGLRDLGQENVTDQKVLTHIFASGNSEGERLELLAPTDSTSPIAAFLEKKGSGIHHVALNVDNLEVALDYLKETGVKLIDEKPRPGAHRTQIAFIHPHSTGGILVELVQASNA